MQRWTVPGVAVGLLRNGATEFHAYGVQSIETQHPVSCETLFQIGSISKVFAATLIMRLVDDGKLDLDAPVVTYLPDLKLADAQALKTITLRHLLSHQSGLYGDYFDDRGWGDDALAAHVATFDTLEQQYEPGELWAYTNSGFNLAGRVAEVVTDKPLETAMRELIIAPLGLERTFYFAHEAIAYPVAVGHTQVKPGEDAIEIARHYPLPRNVAAAGGVISTVGDLLKFAQFHLGAGTGQDGARVLSAASLRTMQTPQIHSGVYADEWGIGWDLSTISGERVIGHGGATNGFMARLAIAPERGWAIALLTNGARGTALNNRVRDWALEHDLGLTKDRAPEISLTDEQLRQFAGRYETKLGSVTLSVVDGGLLGVYTSKSPLTAKEVALPPVTYQPVGEREFITVGGEGDGSHIYFIPPTNGRPLRLHTGRLFDKVG